MNRKNATEVRGDRRRSAEKDSFFVNCNDLEQSLPLTKKTPLPYQRISASLRVLRGVFAVAVVSWATVAHAQSTAQKPDSTKPQPKRRALDIRASAPAPEVVTIRPREIPQFSRSLLAPAMIKPPTAQSPAAPGAAGDTRGRTIVIFPGSMPIVKPDSGKRPQN